MNFDLKAACIQYLILAEPCTQESCALDSRETDITRENALNTRLPPASPRPDDRGTLYREKILRRCDREKTTRPLVSQREGGSYPEHVLGGST